MRNHRNGFTLAEMLTVIVLILLLTGLAVAILPGISSKRAASRAADQLQGWMVQARSKAQRDQTPTGLHLFVDPVDGMCRRAEFVQQPDPLQLKRNGRAVLLTLGPPSGQYTAVGRISPFDGDNQTFRVGDLIEVKSGSFLGWYRIEFIPTLVNGQPDLNGTLGLVGETVGVQTSTIDYRIIRRWRSLVGEQILQLPKGTMIDLAKNAPAPTPLQDVDSNYGKPLPVIGGEVVFLFSPTGGLIDSPTRRPTLWVRHEENKGEPTLISVSSSGGAVAAHKVNDEKAPGMNQRLAAPFLFTEDGLGSGL